MARVQSLTPDATRTISIDLDRLLKRLETQLLTSDLPDALRTSSYERARVGANVEHARTLLLRLEHASTNIKTTARKQSALADAAAKRDLITRLNTRLLELEQVDDDDDDDDDDEHDKQPEKNADDEDSDSSDDEAEHLARTRAFAPAVETNSGLDTDRGDGGDAEMRAAAAGVAEGLRARRSAGNNSNSNTQSQTKPQTPAASTTALFSGRTDAAKSNTQTTERTLDEARREQDLLTSSLVTLARSLKQSSVTFAESLEGEKDVVKRAEAGLDRNALGMESAGRRMGALRRMTEGQGWWGRVKLYAIIAALWVAAFLFVFAGPKLRF